MMMIGEKTKGLTEWMNLVQLDQTNLLFPGRCSDREHELRRPCVCFDRCSHFAEQPEWRNEREIAVDV